MTKYQKLGVACVVAGTMAMASTASAAFSGTAKNFGGVDWNILNDYGVTQTQVSATGNPLDTSLPYLTFRNETAGTGAAIWLNIGAGDNWDSGMTAANKAFFQTMRSSSIPGHEVSTGLTDTSPWVSWTLRMNYAMGTSQNDVTINGPGGTASSVGHGGQAGFLAYEPGSFGGDRLSIGAQFNEAYDIAHKGTLVGSREWNASNYSANTTWELTTGTYSDDVLRTGGLYPVHQSDIVTWTVGKRLNGTVDIWLKAPNVKTGGVVDGGWTHYVGLDSIDNPDWFFYQFELRARGGSGTPIRSEQDLLAFSWGNDWSGTWSPPPPPQVPEPASLGLLLIGGLTILARRRKA
jgi:hypothetical protein